MGDQADLDVQLGYGHDAQEECEITGLYPAWCAHCRGIVSPEEEEKKRQDAIDDFIRSME